MGDEEHRKRKPDGGFKFITVAQLCLAWSSYRERRIRFLDLRTYFACQEVVARRCLLPRGQSPDYRGDEVARLLGGGGEESARASIRRLEGVGLLTFSAQKLTFAASPEQLQGNSLDGFWEMFHRITNNRRRVPVPRRTLRLIAGGARQVVVATILGHLLRCLYYRDEACSPVGAVKASWVGTVFGVDERNVKAARGHLEDIGWLLPYDTAGLRMHPQIHRNRYGKTVVINLAWSAPETVDNSVGASAGSPPPRAEIPSSSPPPSNSDRELSSRSENQKPAVPADRPGFSIKTPKAEKAEKPSFQNVVPEDLKDTSRLFTLFEEVTKRKLIPHNERERLNFVAAAEHARVIGSKNPCGLFAWLVRHRKWEFITEGDDEAAHRRIKVHLFGDPREREKTPLAEKPKPQTLSVDAQFARAVRQIIRQQALSTDPFVVVKQARPEWTKERWDAATKELDDLVLSGLGQAARPVGELLSVGGKGGFRG